MRKIKLFREFVENSSSLIDAKMQELKDLIDGMSGDGLIYEWENKSDHEIVVNFTNKELSIRYEFDIDRLSVTKFTDDVSSFQADVIDIDEGLDMIEKDIHGILGISEGLKNKKVKQKYFEENYTFEDFTQNDVEDVRDLLDGGLTEVQIAIELNFGLQKVKQIINSIKKNRQF